MTNGNIDRTTDRVRLRGTREGIDIYLPAHLNTEELIGQVEEEITGSREFLRDSTVRVTLGDRTPDRHELTRLLDILRVSGIATHAISVARPDHQKTLREWGIDAISVDPATRTARGSEQPHDERTALYIKRTLRSGSAIHSDGDVVILGDVNPGAEVTAVGDIIIWGVLRGTVHAGLTGDATVRICALRLQPTQLRIGAIVARPPDGKQRDAVGPQSAYIQDAMIVVEPWRGSERRGRMS
jgi:septum site-determining protein MinC